jgi:hypothetical protein
MQGNKECWIIFSCVVSVNLFYLSTKNQANPFKGAISHADASFKVT